MIDTDRRVRRQLLGGALAAYRGERDPLEGDPLGWCSCFHHRDEHHGPGGEGACSAAGCGCQQFSYADVECPDCRRQWSLALPACPACGLTGDEIAARVTAQAERGRSKRWLG